jgi:hypothetical protein
MLSPQEAPPLLRRINDRPGAGSAAACLLPSLLTMGNMFCGLRASSTRCGRVRDRGPFIGFAVVIDGLDGRIARMTGTTSAFGVEFDSLADISFGIAPAILSFAWGLQSLGRRAGPPASCSSPARRCASRASTSERGRRRQALFRRHAESGGRRHSCRNRLRVSGGSTTIALRCRLAMVIVPAILW